MIYTIKPLYKGHSQGNLKMCPFFNKLNLLYWTMKPEILLWKERVNSNGQLFSQYYNTTSLLNSLITKKDHANYANWKQGPDRCSNVMGLNLIKKPTDTSMFITGEIKTQIPTIMVVLPKEVWSM